jgi:hypothetical protein
MHLAKTSAAAITEPHSRLPSAFNIQSNTQPQIQPTQRHILIMASSATTKTPVADPKPANGEAAPEKKPAVLEEDDEFEDFPIEGTPSCPPPSLSPSGLRMRAKADMWYL